MVNIPCLVKKCNNTTRFLRSEKWKRNEGESIAELLIKMFIGLKQVQEREFSVFA